MPEPLLTRAEDVAVVLVLLLVVALVALTWLSLVVARQRRELCELRRRLTPSIPESRARQAATWAMRTVLDAPSRVRERGFFDAMLMTPIEDLARIAREERATIDAVSDADGNVVIMFSDIEESTRLNQELGDDVFVKLLDEHDKMLRAQVSRHRGRVVKSQGDGFMVVFGQADDAVKAALAIEARAPSAGRHSRRTPVRVRIGLNSGPVVTRDGDYFGTNVAKAARIAALAEGGQILVSSQVAEQIDGVARSDPAGTFELRGLVGEHDIYAVRR